MKRFFIAVAVVVLATAAQASETGKGLKKVDAEYVCMVNNMAYEKQQVKAVVDGKAYYGCCPMCKEKLEKDAGLRKAVDPVSGKQVDKATAVIGAMDDGMVHYFENDANLMKYSTHMDHASPHGEKTDAHSGH